MPSLQRPPRARAHGPARHGAAGLHGQGTRPRRRTGDALRKWRALSNQGLGVLGFRVGARSREVSMVTPAPLSLRVQGLGFRG